MSRVIWQKPADFDPADPMAECLAVSTFAGDDIAPFHQRVSKSGYAAIVIDHETGDQVLYLGDPQTPPPADRCTVVDWLALPA